MAESPAEVAEQSENEEATPDEAPVVATDTRTVEDVEATWSHRMSERDRAHNAEVQALREQATRAEAAAEAARRELSTKATGDMTEVERAQAERDELRAELERERSARAVAEMKTKYPKVAADLPEKAFAALDEGELAAREARLSAEPPPPPSRQDPNAAPRKGAPAEPPKNPTSDDLKADLARYGPDWAAQVRG